jgi:hypothetical protein
MEGRMHLLKISVICLAVFLAGCADLTAIRDFSKISADSAGFTKVVDDYAQSGDRRLAYMYPTLEKNGEVARLQSEKELRDDQAKELLNVLKAVESYMSALGDLAGDQLVDSSTNIQNLTAQLNTAVPIDPKISKPASAIATLVGKMIADGYRQRNLREAINEANPYIQDINKNFALLLQVGFPLALRAEKATVSDYYDYWHNVASDHNELAAIEILRIKKRDDLARYPEKENALAAYREVFKKIAEGHQMLFDNQQDLKNKALLGTIKQYAIEIRDTMKTVQAAN